MPDTSASSRRALERLGAARFRTFLHAANAEGECIAVRLCCDDLARGANPEDVLLDPTEGYSLSVRGAGGRCFTIAFGCVPGPLVGDGGEWEVEFDEAGRVVRCDAGDRWIA